MPRRYDLSSPGETREGWRLEMSDLGAVTSKYSSQREEGSQGRDEQDTSQQSKTSSEAKVNKDKKPNVKTVSVFEMYKYSSTVERVSLVFGMLCTLTGGTGPSVCVWYSSNVLNDLYSLNITGNDSSEQQYDALIDIAKSAAVVIAIVDVAMFILLFIGMTLWLRAADKIVQRVRRLAFNNLVRQHMGFFDLNEPGAIITSLAEDCIVYQSGIGEKVISPITWFSQMIAATVVSFIGDWLLTIIAFCLLPITLITAGIAARHIQKLMQKQMTAYSRAGVVAEESISAIRVVQAFCGENKQSRRYDERLDNARKLGQRAGYFVALSNCVSYLIFLIVITVVCWVGGIRFMNGKLTKPGVILQVTMSAGTAMRNLGWITNNNEFISSARAAAASIYRYIQCVSEIDSLDPSGQKPSEVSGEVSFEDVHFEYPSRPNVPVLKGLTLTVPRGRNVALVGPSGCGKSTIIQLIQRYYDPRKGSVKLDGKDVRELNLKWLRNQIGVVSQEPTLFATTVEENIGFGREGCTRDEIIACAKEADAHNFIQQLPDQYDTLLNEAATLLSRGEKQRISLARALVRQPEVLLLDECTSALDTESEVVVQKALEKAAKFRTTITIAHRLSTVRNCDTLYVINNGILSEFGNHEDLMGQGGLYNMLVQNQMKGMEEEHYVDSDSDSENEMTYTSKKTRSPSLVTTVSARETLEQLQRGSISEMTEVETKANGSLKRILSYNKPEWCLMIVGCVCSLIFGFGLPAISILTGEVYVMFRLDDPEEQHDILFLFCPIMIGVVVATSIGTFLAFATLKYAGEWLTQRLRSHLFRHILRMDIGWFDRKENQVGALTSRLATDASRVQSASGTVLVTLFSVCSTMVGAVVIAVVYGWRLGLPILGYTPVTVSISIVQGVVTTRFKQWTAKASRESGKIIAEVIDKIHTVATLTKEDFFEQRFNHFFDELAIKERRKAVLGGVAWGSSYFFIGGAFLLSFPYGMYRVAEGDIKPENIIRIFFGIAASTLELARLTVYATEFSHAKATAGELFQLLDRESEIDPQDPSGIKPEHTEGELQVNKCFFKYPTRQDLVVLKNFKMEVSRGQFIALVGPSGSGKTTAISLFERFYDILGGDVTMDGIPIRDLNLEWVRKQMAIVTQDPILFNIGLNENIAFGDNTREVSQQEIIAAAKSANIHNFIASLPAGYDTLAGTKGTQLSGGQKQRVSIARALVKNPKILLLDDAMSALDAESEKQVEVALENARQGRTTIMVSHRLSSIIKADMIYVLVDGKVVERGTHTALMAKRSHYYKLQEASMGLAE